MNRPDPDWYEDLRGEPLRSRMFTPELASRIRAEAVRMKPAGSALSRRVQYIGAAAGCLAAVLLLALQQDRLPWFALPDGKSVFEAKPESVYTLDGSGKSVSERELAAAGGEPGDSGYDRTGSAGGGAWSDDPRLIVKNPTLNEWQAFIDELYPQRQRMEVFNEESIDDGRRIVLSRKITAVDDAVHAVIAAYEFEWNFNGWQQRVGMTYTPLDNLQDSDEAVLTGWFGSGPDEQGYDIFMGFILDPGITAMRVTDHLGETYEARLFKDMEGVTAWFAMTPVQERRLYEVEGLDKDGNVVYSKSHHSHSLKNLAAE